MTNHFRARHIVPCLALLLALVRPAAASLISTISGDLEQASTPVSFSDFLSPQNTNAVIFEEASGLELLTEYGANISASGLYQSDAELTPAQIASGTIISSFILYHDAPNNIGAATGSVTFLGTIVGISVISFSQLVPNIYVTSGYELSDSLFDTTSDRVYLSQDLHTVAFCSKVDGATDGMRILLSSDGGVASTEGGANPFADNCTTTAVVAGVPEPSTIALIGAALLSLFGFGMMRRRAEA